MFDLWRYFFLAWTPEQQEQSLIIPSTIFDGQQKAAIEAGQQPGTAITDDVQKKEEYFEALRRSMYSRKKMGSLDIFEKKYLFFQKHMKHEGSGHWLLVVVKNARNIFTDTPVSFFHMVLYGP